MTADQQKGERKKDRKKYAFKRCSKRAVKMLRKTNMLRKAGH